MLKAGMKVKVLVSGSYVDGGWTPNQSADCGFGKGVDVVTEANLEQIEVWIRCGRAILLDPPKLKGFYEATDVLPVAVPEPGNSPVDPPAKARKTKRSDAKL